MAEQAEVKATRKRTPLAVIADQNNTPSPEKRYVDTPEEKPINPAPVAETIEKKEETPIEVKEVTTTLFETEKPKEIEKVVEVKETAKDEKKEEKKEEVIQSFSDLFSDNNTETPEQKEFNQYKEVAQKYKEVEPLLDDPHVKALIEAKRSGQFDYKSFVKETFGDDISGLSDEQIFKKGMAELEGIANADEIETEWENHQLQTPNKQKKELERIKNEFNNKNTERVSKYGQSQEQLRKEQEAVFATHVEQGKTELKARLSSITGKNYYGTVITPEMVAQVEKDVLDKSNYFYDPSKGYLIQDAVEYCFFKRCGETIIKNAITNTTYTTTEKVIEEVVQPSKNQTPPHNRTGGDQTPEDKNRSAVQNWMKKRNTF